MEPSLIVKLLNDVHTYYPIGMPELQNTYPGWQKIEEIIFDKIRNIEDSESQWNIFLKEISNQHSSMMVEDISYVQFPNYYLLVEMEKQSVNGIESVKSLVVIISLLTNYYTAFIKEDHKFKAFIIDSNEHDYAKHTLIYLQQEQSVKIKEELAKLEALIGQFFPEKKYISHDLLFNTIVEGGSLYGRSYDLFPNRYSLYQYLFLNEEYRSFTVLK